LERELYQGFLEASEFSAEQSKNRAMLGDWRLWETASSAYIILFFVSFFQPWHTKILILSIIATIMPPHFQNPNMATLARL